MPRMSAGGPPAINDEQIIRTDVSPEDLRKMTDDELDTFLAKIRNDRETAPPRAAKSGSSTRKKEVEGGSPDDLDSMD